MTKQKLSAHGTFVKSFGDNEHPHTIVLRIKDSQGNIFQQEEISLSGEVFLEHLMKAFKCDIAPHLRNLKVTIIFEE